MTVKKRRLVYGVLALAILLLALLAWQLISGSGPRLETGLYTEIFDSAGTWIVGQGAFAEGKIAGGVYEMSLLESGDIFWATAGRNFADGIYEIEATPLEGATDNGYGILFRVDNKDEAFYIFKVSSDGYVFIGLCTDSCAEEKPLVNQDWFSSPAVRQGLGVTNTLRVVAAGQEFTFYVNDEEVGRVSDDTLAHGDIGLISETFTPGGLRVAFDNFTVTPLNNE